MPESREKKEEEGKKEQEEAATQRRCGRVVAITNSKQTMRALAAQDAPSVWLLLCFNRFGMALLFVASFNGSPQHYYSHTQPTTRDLPQLTMSKTRTSLQRQAEQIDVHEDEQKEDDVNSELGESMDSLDESGHTVDSSDEEVEDTVAEDMSRFEETFVGINKRFRLINRIGEGKSAHIGLPYAGSHSGAYNAGRDLLNRL